MTTPGCIYRFRLGRDATGAYVGELVDDWGWTIALRAEVVERNGARVCEGIATAYLMGLIAIPEYLVSLPLEDRPPH